MATATITMVDKKAGERHMFTVVLRSGERTDKVSREFVKTYTKLRYVKMMVNP